MVYRPTPRNEVTHKSSVYSGSTYWIMFEASKLEYPLSETNQYQKKSTDVQSRQWIYDKTAKNAIFTYYSNYMYMVLNTFIKLRRIFISRSH